MCADRCLMQGRSCPDMTPMSHPTHTIPRNQGGKPLLLLNAHPMPDTRPLTSLPVPAFAPYIHKASKVILLELKTQSIILLLKILSCSHLNIVKKKHCESGQTKALHTFPEWSLTCRHSADAHGMAGTETGRPPQGAPRRG